MGRWQSLCLLMTLGLLTTSCGFVNSLLNRGDDADPAEQEVVEDIDADPADDPAQASGEDPSSDEELFQEAILPGLPSASEIALAELLPSTDPNERFKEIQKERSDPYSYVPIPPPPSQTPPPPVDRPNRNSGAPGNGTNRPPSVTPQPGPSTPPPAAIVPVPPLEPVPVVATQVSVSGVLRLNGQTFAIVKAPGEPSRHVTVGDRLSKGAVLVKRIETRPGRQPIVVLEERGIEVALEVGSEGGSEGATAFQVPQSTSEVAALPFLPARN